MLKVFYIHPKTGEYIDVKKNTVPIFMDGVNTSSLYIRNDSDKYILSATLSNNSLFFLTRSTPGMTPTSHFQSITLSPMAPKSGVFIDVKPITDSYQTNYTPMSIDIAYLYSDIDLQHCIFAADFRGADDIAYIDNSTSVSGYSILNGRLINTDSAPFSVEFPLTESTGFAFFIKGMFHLHEFDQEIVRLGINEKLKLILKSDRKLVLALDTEEFETGALLQSTGRDYLIGIRAILSDDTLSDIFLSIDGENVAVDSAIRGKVLGNENPDFVVEAKSEITDILVYSKPMSFQTDSMIAKAFGLLGYKREISEPYSIDYGDKFYII